MTPKTVLVTGGALRLGADICRAFATAGWTVWCHYQNSGDAAGQLCASIQDAGGVAHMVQANLADSAQRQALIAHITQHSGPLHCLVNNASSFEPDAADALQMQVLRQQLEVNLIAPMELASQMAQSLHNVHDAQPGLRSVIHVLDQKVFNLNPDYFSYSISKLALERSVALSAQALAPALRVCGVAPGLLFVSGPQSAENFAAASRVNLLRTPIAAAQVAQSCLFLAQNPCITGVTLTVDNGQHLVPLPRDVMFVVEQALASTSGEPHV